MPRIVVLADGETYTDIEGCVIVEYGDDIPIELTPEIAGDPKDLICEIIAGRVPGRVVGVKIMDDTVKDCRGLIEQGLKRVEELYAARVADPSAEPAGDG